MFLNVVRSCHCCAQNPSMAPVTSLTSLSITHALTSVLTILTPCYYLLSNTLLLQELSLAVTSFWNTLSPWWSRDLLPQLLLVFILLSPPRWQLPWPPILNFILFNILLPSLMLSTHITLLNIIYILLIIVCVSTTTTTWRQRLLSILFGVTSLAPRRGNDTCRCSVNKWWISKTEIWTQAV